MLGAGWLIHRQAQEAINNGDWEEARRLLSEPSVRGLRRTRGLLRRLSNAHVERGEQFLRNDNPAAAWRELIQAEQIGVDSSHAAIFRRRLTQQGLTEMRELLAAGRPVCAVECAAKWHEWSMRHPDLDALEQTANQWAKAWDLADRGDFGQCLSQLDQIHGAGVRIDRAVEQFRRDVLNRQQLFAKKSAALYEAGRQRRWPDVLQYSDEVLALAPKHVEAQRLRTNAWKALEPDTTVGRTRSFHPQRDQQKNVPERRTANQFLLWIDGIGGYLVCLNNEIRIGQAVSESPVDIPIFADVSRHHASIQRDSEGYTIQAFRQTQVNSKHVEKALLQDGDRVTIGNSCQFRFWQSVPVSASAKLEIASGHRLRYAVDGILLMADTLVLGSGPQAHILLPDTSKPIVFYRMQNEIGVRHAGNLRINGQPVHEKGIVEPGATVLGDDFSLAIESVVNHGV